MSCTCFKKHMPCPIHGEPGLTLPGIVEHSIFVIRICQRLANNEKWFFTITKDAIKVAVGSDRENRYDAMLEATCWLNSQNQKPKETCKQ
jgi:hypothetical protein